MTPSFIRKLTLLSVAIIGLGSQGILRADWGDDNPGNIAGEFNGNVTTGCSYDPYTGNAKRSITDLVVPGAVGAYPLAFTRTMNSRLDSYTTIDHPFGMGGWRHNYQWEVDPQDFYSYDPCATPPPRPNYVVTYPDGKKTNFVPDGGVYRSDRAGIADRFTPLSDALGDGTYVSYLLMPDGGQIEFTARVSPSPPPQCLIGPMQPESSLIHYTIGFTVSGIIDPYGLKTTITYTDFHAREIDKIQEPGGRYLKVVYAFTNGARLIEHVEEHASAEATNTRNVQYQYTNYGPAAVPVLQNVFYFNDPSIVASYTYQASNFSGGSPLIKTCYDPMYAGAMTGIAYDFVQNQGLPHGYLHQERYFDGSDADNGPAVSTLSGSGNNRTETRGDGCIRSFTYSNGLLVQWTDFKGNQFSQEHYTTAPVGFVHKVFELGHETRFDRHPTTGNVTGVTYPPTPSDENGPAAISIGYSNDSYPCLVMSHTNERSKVTAYTRDDPNGPWVTHIDHPDGIAQEDFLHNEFGQVVKHKRKNGYYEHMLYDRGLLKCVWNPIQSDAPPGPSSNLPRTEFEYYDVNHPWHDRIRTIKDPRGKITTFEYETVGGQPNQPSQPRSGRGLITRISHQDNSYKSFHYDPQTGMKDWEENELHERTTYRYDAYKRLITVLRPLPNNRTSVTSYEYGHLHDFDAPIPSPNVYTAPTVTTITTQGTEDNPGGIVTDFRYDQNFRLVRATTGANTNDVTTTTYEYDDVNRQVIMTDPRTKQTKTDYDWRGRQIKVTSPTVTGENGPYVTEWLYDATSNLRLITQPDQTAIERTYDGMNRLETNTVWKYDHSDSRFTEYTYWPSGRLHELKVHNDDLVQVTTFEQYDERDLLKKMKYPTGQVLDGWVYNENGAVTDRPVVGSTVKQHFTYDDRNRLWHMYWSNGSDFSDFRYDYVGRLTSAVNPYAAITRHYDGGLLTLDRQELAANVNTPEVTITPIGITSRKTHGSAGTFDIDLPLSGAPGVECRNGPDYSIRITFSEAVTVEGAAVIAGIGEVTSTSVSGNYVTVNLANVSNAQVIWVKVYGLSDGNNYGELVVPMHILIGDTVVDGVVNGNDASETSSRSGQTTNHGNFRSDLNADGVINTQDLHIVTAAAGTDEPVLTAPDLAPHADVTYQYYDDGRLKNISVPNEYGLTYHYDAIGRLRQIMENNQDNHYQYSYDRSSNVTARENYVGGNLISSLSFVRDEINRITNETIYSWSDPIAELRYGYDTMSRLTSMVRIDGLADAYGYNFTGEFKEAQYGFQPDGNGGWCCPQSFEVFDYDKAGNRNSVNGLVYGTNVLNQYYWTPDGPVTNGTQHEISSYLGVNYHYLADTRLASVDRPSSGGTDVYALGYDALGRTVRRTTNGLRSYYVYNGAQSILEYDASGVKTASSVYGLGVDEVIARNNNGAPQYLMQDRLGSTVMVMGPKGDVLEEYRYDAFGTPTILAILEGTGNDSLINNHILFGGREWVSRFGFYENRARAYHPALGRFMSEDPLHFGAGDTNLYRYCGNDPTNRRDPSGLVDPSGEVTLERVTVTGSFLPDGNFWNAFFGYFQVGGTGRDEPSQHQQYDPDRARTTVTFDKLPPEVWMELHKDDVVEGPEGPGPDVDVNSSPPVPNAAPPFLAVSSGGNPYRNSAPFIGQLGRGFDGRSLMKLRTTLIYGVAWPAAGAVALPVAVPLAINAPQFVASVEYGSYMTILYNGPAIVNTTEFLEAALIPGAAVASNPTQLWGSVAGLFLGP